MGTAALDVLAGGPRWAVEAADCRTWLASLPAGCVQTCVTSPPYYGLRDYGHPGQVGLEPTPADYVAALVAVFAEVRRVLRDDGTVWLNLGDSYAAGGGTGKQNLDALGERFSGGGHKHSAGLMRRSDTPAGLKSKDLLGIPWRVAFALQADGWYLRQDIVWSKPNPMPESVRDRCTKAHEYLFLLSKQPSYFWDGEAIAEAAASEPHAPGNIKLDASRNDFDQMQKVWGANGTRNRRSVWEVTPAPYKGAHFATMPPELVRPCVLAGTPEAGCCGACGAPWRRVVEREQGDTEAHTRPKRTAGMTSRTSTLSLSGNGSKEWAERGGKTRTLGWQPACSCGAPAVPSVVLDPFAGSGTTLAVAVEEGRRAVGCDLNPTYVKLARKRMAKVTPRLAAAYGPADPEPVPATRQPTLTGDD